jgi:hypothetical protein
MIPNFHIHEQLMFERCQRLMAGLRQELGRRPPCLVANIVEFLLKLGSSLKQLDTRERQVVYDH